MARLIDFTYTGTDDDITVPLWDDIKHHNPKFGDILIAEDSFRAEKEFVVGTNEEIIYIGKQIDWAELPISVTSLLEDPVKFYEDIGEFAILFLDISPIHYDYYGLHDVPAGASVSYDYLSGEFNIYDPSDDK